MADIGIRRAGRLKHCKSAMFQAAGVNDCTGRYP
jgi:hypothetical protein